MELPKENSVCPHAGVHRTCLTIQRSYSNHLQVREEVEGTPTPSHQGVDGAVACRPRSTSRHVQITKDMPVHAPSFGLGIGDPIPLPTQKLGGQSPRPDGPSKSVNRSNLATLRETLKVTPESAVSSRVHSITGSFSWGVLSWMNC